jgi:FkbM family methyltransferase
MLIPFSLLFKKYNLNITGILHVGAHEAEEIVSYENCISRNKILWVEAIPDKVEFCKNTFPEILIENAVVSDKMEDVTFYVSNNGQSSSFLEMGLHKNYYPDIYYTHSFNVLTNTLKNILLKYKNKIQINFINLDIQGVELKALKGMQEYLKDIDYIYTEVNSDYVYKNCCLVEEMDKFLSHFNFSRVETCWSENKWGDAFYIKQTINNNLFT